MAVSVAMKIGVELRLVGFLKTSPGAKSLFVALKFSKKNIANEGCMQTRCEAAQGQGANVTKPAESLCGVINLNAEVNSFKACTNGRSAANLPPSFSRLADCQDLILRKFEYTGVLAYWVWHGLRAGIEHEQLWATRFMKFLRVAFHLLWACGALGFSCFAADVLTYHNDNEHTGWNPNEAALNPSNVRVSTFGLLQNLAVDAPVFAQPLYASGVPVGGSSHNLLIVATENDSVYAFDADSLSQTPLWKSSLLGAGEVPAIPNNGCGDLLWSNDPSGETKPALGITSTPVIDRQFGSHGTIFLVAVSVDSATATKYVARLHALDLSTGREISTPKSPVVIKATYPSHSGTLTFNPQAQRNRAALLLQNGIIYTGWSSQCDNRPFYGWIIAYNESTLTRASVRNLNPNNPAEEGGAGVWGGGAALTGSPEGSIYLLSGDGLFDTILNSSHFPSNGNYGDSFLKLSKNLSVQDYFTPDAPNNQSELQTENLDLGSGGVVVLPNMTDANGVTRSLAVGGGKAILDPTGFPVTGPVYIVDRTNMGKYNSPDKVYQTLFLPEGTGQNGIWGSPAYFNDGTFNNIYFGPEAYGLVQYVFTNARLPASPNATSNNLPPYTIFDVFGATPSISSNGTDGSSAIVWAYQNLNPPDETTNPPRYGTPVLHAFRAIDHFNGQPSEPALTEIYGSQQNPQDDLGQPPYNALSIKFGVPTVCNGKVFIGTLNSVAVFGLLPNPR
jgi:hypothetical protein